MTLSAGSFSRRVSIRRQTAYLVDPEAAAANHTVDRQPVRESLLQILLSGGTARTGTVTVTGTVGGVAGVQEVFTFTGETARRGSKLFTAVSAVTTTGLADEPSKPTLALQAVGRDGSVQNASYAVASDVPAEREDRSDVQHDPMQPGSSPKHESTWVLFYDDAYAIRQDDLVVEDATGETWRVMSAVLLPSPLQPFQRELETTRYDT